MVWDLVLDALMDASELEVPREVVFRYIAKEAQTVSVVGQFNDWDRARLPMTQGAAGEWTARLELRPGVYSYLFVVDNSKWVPDPNAPRIVDLNGNPNSQLVVVPHAYDGKPGKRGDGIMTLEAFQHRPDARDTVRRSADEWMLNCKTRAGDVDKVSLRLGDAAKPMRRVATDPLFDTWQIVVRHDAAKPLRYQFELTDGGRKALIPQEPVVQDSSRYLLPAPPQWVRRSVFYQIFPERFANGDPKNDPADVQPWGTKPAPRNFMGGDLAGIRQKLSYLDELGIDGLYLNPICESPTNHAYDVMDYKKVNPKFGSNAEFGGLVADAHRLKMKVMLDGVFNHSSVEHPFFQDVVKNEKNSKYLNWYTILKFPIEVRDGQQTYRAWAGVKHMPKLNTSNPEVRKYVAEIGAHWIKEYGIDAWRLDVANEVDPACWREFRQAVRGARNDAYILGEDWGDARASLQGDQWDATMNYQWRAALLDVLGGRMNAKQFGDRLQTLREQIPEDVFFSQFNLLSSHDTPRIMTLLNKDMDKVKQAVLMLLAYPGVPCLYYGDEIGMEGGHDPDCRRCMEWDSAKWNKGLNEFYRRAIMLRREQLELQTGSLRVLRAEARSGYFVFERQERGRRSVAAWNFGRTPVLVGPLGQGLEMRLANGFREDTLAPGGCVLFSTPWLR